MHSNPCKSKTLSEGLSSIHATKTNNLKLFQLCHPIFNAQSSNFQSSNQNSKTASKQSHTSPPLSRTPFGKVPNTMSTAFILMSPFSDTMGIHHRKFNRKTRWPSTINLQDCPVIWSLAQKAKLNGRYSKRFKPKRPLPKRNPFSYISSPTYCHWLRIPFKCFLIISQTYHCANSPLTRNLTLQLICWNYWY